MYVLGDWPKWGKRGEIFFVVVHDKSGLLQESWKSVNLKHLSSVFWKEHNEFIPIEKKKT